MRFKNWMIINELENPFKADISAIEFDTYMSRSGESGYKSDFVSDDGKHTIFFTEKSRTGFPNMKCYDVNLTDPYGGYNLTNKSRNPSAVYSSLVKIVLAFVKQFNPELISFLSSDPNMEVMYKRFYDRYMKDMYPIVQYGLFLRKDLFDKMKNKEKSEKALEDWDTIAGEAKETKRVIQRFLKSLPLLQNNFVKKYITLDPSKIAHTGMVDKDFPKKPFVIVPTGVKMEDEFVVVKFYFISKNKKLDFAKAYFVVPNFFSAFKNTIEKRKSSFLKLSLLDKHRISSTVTTPDKIPLADFTNVIKGLS